MQEALKGENWVQTMDEEIKNAWKKWNLEVCWGVKRQETNWLQVDQYGQKHKSDGTLDQYKARPVAKHTNITKQYDKLNLWQTRRMNPLYKMNKSVK
jgi:hypothetical protein